MYWKKNAKKETIMRNRQSAVMSLSVSLSLPVWVMTTMAVAMTAATMMAMMTMMMVVVAATIAEMMVDDGARRV